jgi:hypothetical protein
MAAQGDIEAVLDLLYWNFAFLSLIISIKFERINVVV